MKLATIVPTFQRNQNHLDLIDSFLKFSKNSMLFFVLEKRDEHNYKKVIHPRIVYLSADNSCMAEALNYGFNQVKDLFDYIGFMGDDHRFRTPFEKGIEQANSVVVYGNDLLQRQNLPTQVWVKADFLKAIGYFCPPNFKHLYLDNTWLEWGRRLGITYLENVIVEHLHPASGKVANDENYDRVNSPEMYSHDKQAFDNYLANNFENDIKKYESFNNRQ